MPHSTKVKDLPSQEELWELFDYNPETGELFNRETGHALGTRTKDGPQLLKHIRAKIDGSEYLAHRIIWTMVNGQIPEGMTIDHINCDSRDNRLCNLRLATQRQQLQNRREWAKTGVKGVYLTRNGSYYSNITVNGRTIYLGSFGTVEEAAAEFERASIQYCGHFSRAISASFAA